MSTATAFIYAPRERQIQTGVAAGTIDPIRATVMRGRVSVASRNSYGLLIGGAGAGTGADVRVFGPIPGM